MAIQKIFAYNTGSLISGTTQVGDIAISEADVEYSANYGGLQWWGGPDESLGYVIAIPVSGNTQPTPISGITASLGFYGTKNMTNPLDESTFVDLVNGVFNQNFVNGNDAKTWLNDNGYWTSYVVSLCDSFTFIGNNATTTSNSAINDGTSGWDSSAYSLQTFNGPVSVTFQTSANGNILMGGFSYNPTATPGSTYEDTSYGIYLYNSDQIEIYENGGQVAVLNVGTVVSSSDVWKVDYDGTSVKYYYNSTLLYTSTNAVTQPLHVFFPLFTPNEGAVDICVIGTLSSTPTPTPTLTQTPTPTVTETPSGTPSETPTNTPTPTSTDLTSVTTFTISGCTNLNVLVADLGPSSLAPGDVFNFTFTGGTPSGCYRIVEKTVATPTDGATPLLFYVNCAACEATLVTPTPTTTSTPTPTGTPTGTPAETPGATGTPAETPTPTGTPAETPGATPGETPTPTGTPAETPGATPGETPTPTTTTTLTATETQTPTPTPTGTPAETPGATPGETPTPTPTGTPAETPTPTPTGTPAETPGATPGETPTPTPTTTTTLTATETQTPTPTAEPTSTPTGTAAETPTPTAEPTSTPTGTAAVTPTPTAEPTSTPTGTAAVTPTPTAEPTSTPTPTQTQTPTGTPISTGTPTQTPTTSFITSISYSIGYNTNNGGGSYGGYSTPLDSCVSGIPNIVGVYSVNTLGNGTVLYLDAARTQPFISSGGYFIATGGIGIQYYFTYTSSSSDITNCDTLPSQTPTNTPTQTQTPTNTPTTTTTLTATPTPTTTTTLTATPTPSTTTTLTATPTPTQPLTDVTINIGTQNSADGSGEITVYAYTSGNTNVDTNVVVGFKWVGDLSSEITGTVTITNGTSCNNNTFAGATAGENISTFEITSITPTSSGTQSYSTGSIDYPITACP
jgi:hypothetical protein